MIIFKDILTDSELFTDAFSYKLVDGLIYEVEAKQKTFTDNIDDSMIGGNKSAEGGDEEDADGSISVRGYDVAVANNLQEYKNGMDKTTYAGEIKNYMKNLKAALREKDEDIAKEFEGKIQPYMKVISKKFKNLDFYISQEAMKHDKGPGMLIMLEFRTNEKGEETYFFQFFKDGLIEEKC